MRVLFLLLGGACLVLPACGSSMSDRIEQAQATADHALGIARSTSAALDDGTSSGTTLASEVEEAQQAAANALSAADAAQAAAEAAQASAEAAEARADAVDARIDVICARAPSACY